MKNLFIPEKTDSPQISFDLEKKVFEIKGESFSDRSMDFYVPIIQWLDAYLQQHSESITFNFRLLYFNTGSSQRFYEILKMLEKYHNNKGQVVVNWYSMPDESSIIEAGEDFQINLNLPFDIVLSDQQKAA